MYASVERFDQEATTDELIPAGRQIAADLGRLPGFVAYLLLAAEDGQLLAVSLFEDETGLRAAARLPALSQRLERSPGPRPIGPSRVTSGDVIVQRGL